MEDLDRALADAIFGYANAPVSEPMSLTVATEVLTALNPKPANEIDELIASVGVQFPVHVASWSESL